jgi:hypothetical protein
MSEIIVTFDKEGNTTFTVNGVKGSSCKDIVQNFEKALGQVVTCSNTPEFYEEQGNNNENYSNNGDNF